MKRTDEKYIRDMDSARAVFYAEIEEAQIKYEKAIEDIFWNDTELNKEGGNNG